MMLKKAVPDKKLEKRRTPRVNVPLRLSYRLKPLKSISPSETLQTSRVRVLNVSLGGLNFFSLEGALAPGQRLDLELDFGLLPRPLKAAAEVKWAHPCQENGCWMGLQFINMRTPDRQVLANFISQCLSLPSSSQSKNDAHF